MSFRDEVRLRIAMIAGKLFNSMTGISPFQGVFRTTASQPRSRLWDSMDPALAIKESENLAIAVYRIMDAVAGAEWKIVRKGSKAKLPDTDLAVHLLMYPNEFMVWSDLIEVIVLHMLTTKGGYMVETKTAAAGNPIELWPFYPSGMYPVKDPVLFIKEWEYRQAGTIIKIPTDRVHHFKFPHPTDAWNGMGKVEGSESLFNLDIAMSQYAVNFFQNDAVLGTVLETDSAIMGDTKRLLQESIDQMHKGFVNAFKTLVLPKGVKVSPVQSAPREVEFTESKARTGRSIGGIFGLGNMMMGQSDKASKAAAAAEILLFQKFVLKPLLRRMEPRIDRVVKKFNPAYEFQFEKINDDDDELKSIVVKALVDMGAYTRNDAREAFGKERSTVKGMDTFFVPANLVPIEEAVAPPAVIPASLTPFAPKPGKPTTPAANDPNPGAAGDKPKPGEAAPAADAPAPSAAPASGAPAKGRKATWRHGAQLRLHRMASTAKGHSQRILLPRLRGLWGREGARVIAAIESRKDAVGVFMADMEAMRKDVKAIPEDPLGFDEHKKELNRVMRPFYVEALKQDFEITADFIGLDVADAAFGPGDAPFDHRIAKLATRVTGITRTTQDEIERVIREGVEAGLSPTEIARGAPDMGYAGLRGLFDQFKDSRSQLIARTESSTVYDRAATYAYRDSGVMRVDVVGCEDDVIMPGASYGCNSRGIPIDDALEFDDFHPNHRGTMVPAESATNLSADRVLMRAGMTPFTLLDRKGNVLVVSDT